MIDCTGLLISPGFIDIQINGAFGIDFSSVPEDVTQFAKDVDKVARGLLKFGVTSFCPTLITSPSDVYARVLPLVWFRVVFSCCNRFALVLEVNMEPPS